jgi:hypothetical protein
MTMTMTMTMTRTMTLIWIMNYRQNLSYLSRQRTYNSCERVHGMQPATDPARNNNNNHNNNNNNHNNNNNNLKKVSVWRH